MKVKLVGSILLIIGLFLVFQVPYLATANNFSPAEMKQQTVAKSGATGLRPNELGKIMILEYHKIGTPESRYCRTPDNFRKDLQMLYENGYYPVPLEDMVSGNLRVPAGKSPFVLTFDDSSRSQLRYLKQDGKLIIDPDCAAGIMEDFKKKHPGFPLTATFYVIPKGLLLFEQKAYRQQKLQWLVAHGYEIGNHTYGHQNLGKTDDAGVQKQIALCVKEIQALVPGYNVHTIALPFGIHAKNRALEHDGEYQGFKYHNDSILLVGSGPAVSPYSRDFNPYKLERIQAGDTPWGPKAFVETFKKNPTLRYVSGGNPAVMKKEYQLRLKSGNSFDQK